MKLRPSSILAMLGLLSGSRGMIATPDFKIAAMEPPVIPVPYRNRRGKSKGGNGGSGLLRKYKIRTRQPDGYYQQPTPREHMHSAARLRHDIAHNHTQK